MTRPVRVRWRRRGAAGRTPRRPGRHEGVVDASPPGDHADASPRGERADGAPPRGEHADASPPGEHAVAAPPARLLVDAMNVIGSRPDGWWRDRDGAVRRLVAALALLRARDGDAVTVVVDGRPVPDLAAGEHDGVTVVYAARRGRDAADDRIVELLEQGHPADAVVTADRELAARVRALGAAVQGPGTLRRRLDTLADAGRG